jgi:hypothetical protein
MMTESPALSSAEILERFQGDIYPESLAFAGGSAYFVLRTPQGKRLGVLSPSGQGPGATFTGAMQDEGARGSLMLCPLDATNSRALRAVFPDLKPSLFGLKTSFGFGDRLGLATSGHVRALQAAGSGPAPFFAQQSIRENARTHRTPQEVVDDATWGAFQAGWRGPVGADADHLKQPADADLCAEAGYSMYTIDLGDHVDGAADSADGAELLRKVEALPWGDLETTLSDVRRAYTGQSFDLGDRAVTMSAEDLLRAAAKYGRAAAHVARMYRHIAAKGIPFELEVSVDETETPTRLLEHIYIAAELKRLGVQWVSLAPRFVGRFEKGVDYIGDLQALRRDIAGHAAVARALGPYKISLHSGSDKFSVYPIAHEVCGGMIHVKTAGTSYLEALRVAAQTAPALFRQILALGIERYENDRQTYHVSAELINVPRPEALKDADLPGLLDQFDARQVFHVTFGSALDTFGEELCSMLLAHEQDYNRVLIKHFSRHLEPLARSGIA